MKTNSADIVFECKSGGFMSWFLLIIHLIALVFLLPLASEEGGAIILIPLLLIGGLFVFWLIRDINASSGKNSQLIITSSYVEWTNTKRESARVPFERFKYIAVSPSKKSIRLLDAPKGSGKQFTSECLIREFEIQKVAEAISEKSGHEIISDPNFI